MTYNQTEKTETHTLEEKYEKLLKAAKFACTQLAKHNAGGMIEEARMMDASGKGLFEAIKMAEPSYYGIK